MPLLKFSEVISFSSEDPNHPAENLLRADTYRKWKCAAGVSEKQASVTLKLEKLSPIHSLDIGNNGAAFIEVLVAREGGDFQVLLVASSFMTPGDSRNEANMNRVRMFGSDKLNKNIAEQKWDRLKVVCTQPFNKNMQYGLAFITVTAPSEGSSDSTPKTMKLGSFTLKEEEDGDPISVGSVFAKRKEMDSVSPLTGPAAIRAASASAAASLTSSPSLEPKKVKPVNAPDVGFYQLKKTPSSTDPKKTPSSSDGHKERDRNSEKKKERSRETENNRNGDKERKRKDTDEREKGRTSKNNHERKDTPDSNKRKKDSEETKVKRTPSSEAKQRPSASSSTPSSSSKKKTAPFSSLLKNVSFVLSGYQNPERSQIRDMMLEMGARYKTDWDPACTHLICAFTNTPKYQQVKGKGKIVTAKWVFSCHKNKIRYPWRRYSLAKEKGEDSEEEVWAEELLPKEERQMSKSDSVKSADLESPGYKDDAENYSDDEDTDDEIQRVLGNTKDRENDTKEEKPKTSRPSSNKEDEPPSKKFKVEVEPVNNRKNNKQDLKKDLNGTDDHIYDDDTDVDEENKEHITRPDTSALELPTLGDYFKGKHFYIYGNMSNDIRHLLERYIVAFDGILENYMSGEVSFVVTEDDWDDHFDDALSDNASLQFVKPGWIWRCSDKQKLVPFQPFMVVPKE